MVVMEIVTNTTAVTFLGHPAVHGCTQPKQHSDLIHSNNLACIIYVVSS